MLIEESYLTENTSKKICDAIECEDEAIKKIVINVGNYGFVTIFVCNNCISKFLGGN